MKRLRFTLQGKMFVGSLIVAIGVMVMSLWIMYTYALRAIETNATNYIYESVKYADSNLNIMIDDADKINLVMATSQEMLMNAICSEADEASFEWFQTKKRAQEFLSGLVSYKNHIVMAAIMRMDGISIQTSSDLLLKNTVTQDWFKQALQKDSMQMFYNVPEENRIFMCRPVRYGGKIKALAIIELDFEILSQVYNVAPLEQAEMVTFIPDGDCVFTNTQSYQSVNIKEISLANAIASYNAEQRYYTIDGEKKLLVLYSSPINNLTTAGIISYNTLITDALQIRSQMMVIIVFSALLALVMSFLLARLMYRGIANMKKSMGEVQMGMLESRVEVSGNDEIAEMAEVFNRMMDEIQMLMRVLKHKEKQKREAEQNTLLAQIQPHFICNVINSIKYMAHREGQDVIEEVLTALVELLRGVLGNLDEFVPLWQEAEYINDYVKIQQFKYGRCYSITWDVEENLWSAQLPKLILQPIVENALLHGIGEMECGCIDIQVYEHSGIMHCKITDNGKGMTQEAIEQLTSGKKESKSQFRKIGFANVTERIRLIYGDSYGGRVSSFQGVFTCVELSMPLKLGGEEQ
ncbi:MAG: histidine kinase [Angelakisella sp.]